jgi:hypothetical protein
MMLAIHQTMDGTLIRPPTLLIGAPGGKTIQIEVFAAFMSSL